LIGVGLWWVFQLLSIARRRHRTDENMRALRAAAPDSGVVGDDVDAASLPPSHNGRVAAVVAVLVIAFMTMVWLAAYSQPQCNTVGAVMDLVYDQPSLPTWVEALAP
jgi:hypothetical protein